MAIWCGSMAAKRELWAVLIVLLQGSPVGGDCSFTWGAFDELKSAVALFHANVSSVSRRELHGLRVGTCQTAVRAENATTDPGETWHTQRVGPFTSHGGTDWWYVGWDDFAALSQRGRSSQDAHQTVDERLAVVSRLSAKLTAASSSDGFVDNVSGRGALGAYVLIAAALATLAFGTGRRRRASAIL